MSTGVREFFFPSGEYRLGWEEAPGYFVTLKPRNWITHMVTAMAKKKPSTDSTLRFPADLVEMLDLICRWKGVSKSGYVSEKVRAQIEADYAKAVKVLGPQKKTDDD